MKDQNCLVHLRDQTGEGGAGEFRHTARKFIRQVSLRKTTRILSFEFPQFTSLQAKRWQVLSAYVQQSLLN